MQVAHLDRQAVQCGLVLDRASEVSLNPNDVRLAELPALLTVRIPVASAPVTCLLFPRREAAALPGEGERRSIGELCIPFVAPHRQHARFPLTLRLLTPSPRPDFRIRRYVRLLGIAQGRLDAPRYRS